MHESPNKIVYVLTSDRQDIYCSQKKIYVGELTFYPLMGCYRGEGQKILGKYLDFDRTTFKPFILPELEKSRSRFSLYPEA